MSQPPTSPSPLLPYQSRLLSRTSSPSTSSNLLSSSSSGDIPTSNVNKQSSFQGIPTSISSGSGLGGKGGAARKDIVMGHKAGGKSVDLVRGKWEQRAAETQELDKNSNRATSGTPLPSSPITASRSFGTSSPGIGGPSSLSNSSSSVRDRKALWDTNGKSTNVSKTDKVGFMDTVGDSRRQKARSYMASSGSGNLDKEIAAILAGSGEGGGSGSGGENRDITSGSTGTPSSIPFPGSEVRSSSLTGTTSSASPRPTTAIPNRSSSASTAIDAPKTPVYLTPLSDIPKRNTSADEDSLELLTRIKAQLAEEEERTRQYNAGEFGGGIIGDSYDFGNLDEELKKLEEEEQRREEELKRSLDRLLGAGEGSSSTREKVSPKTFEEEKGYDDYTPPTANRRDSWRLPTSTSSDLPSTPLRKASLLSTNPLYNLSGGSDRLNLSPSSTPQRQPASKSGFRNIITPPKTNFPSSFVTSSSSTTSVPVTPSSLGLGIGRGLPSSASFSGGKTGSRIPSIGKTDGRRLGKHLPRIASGHEGHIEDSREEEEEVEVDRSKPQSSSLDLKPKPSPVPEEHERVVSPTKKARPQSQGAAALRSLWENTAVQSAKEMGSTVIGGGGSPASIGRRNSVQRGKRQSVDLTSPMKRIVPDGKGMQGLFGKGVSKMDKPSAGKQEGIAGAPGRIRLSRLPLASTSAALAPAPLPSKKLTMGWMDRQRKELGAYEYLCHVGEAQQWIEGCLDEELGFGVVEMEEGMRDGVALAKLARVYQGEEAVKTIWEDKKHRFRQSDNINYFLTWIREIGLPETFIFELTDLYDKKNIPKVIFCIHTLSHLLARLGKAEKMGNLVGQFDFSDEQLANTQKGLQGVAMPNFSSVGAALAKECDFEPEEEPETEEEERDRLLLECEGDITQLQTGLRSYLAQQRASRVSTQLALASKSILLFQSRARGALDRKQIRADLAERQRTSKWVAKLQAHIRGAGSRSRWQQNLYTLGGLMDMSVALQAHSRTALARRKLLHTQMAMLKQRDVIVRLQAAARAKLGRKGLTHKQTSMRRTDNLKAMVAVQSQLRGMLARQRCDNLRERLHAQTSSVVKVQARVRGALFRRTLRAQVQTLDDATDTVISIQASARAYIAKRRHEKVAKAFEQVQPAVISLQALARARLRSRQHADMRKSLAKIETTAAVGGLQALLRSKLAKRSTTEQKKQLHVVMPDVVGVQAQARGVLARREYREWVDYLHDGDTQAGISFLQQLLRGYMARRKFLARVWQLRQNMSSIIRAQAIWRGRKQRQTYQKVISGFGVDVAAIQNFMHLLEDSEADFTEAFQIEHLRRKVVERIRGNQLLESQITELDTKIALILQNRLSFDDLVRVKKMMGHMAMDQEQQTFEVAHMDPFSHNATLEKTTKRKLELYQQMFFLLQTEPRYLGRLLRIYSEVDPDDQRRKTLQSTTLALFGFAQGRREEFLLLKLMQLGLHEQIVAAPEIHHLIDSRPIVLEVALAFVRSQSENAIKPILHHIVTDVVKDAELDLCIDPVSIYHRILNDEETESGIISTKARDVDAYHAVHVDPTSGQAFAENLSALQLHTSELLKALYASTAKFPFAIRFAAREMLLALRVKTKYELPDEDLTPIIARLLILPYLTPALIAPDSQGITSNVIGALARQNLSEMAKLVARIGAGVYRGERLDPNIFGPLEAFIAAMTLGFADWIMELASVDDAETHLNTESLVEVAVEPKPITLTRAEIYSVHFSIAQYEEELSSRADDPMRMILTELGGVPQIYQEGQTVPITLALTARFAQIKDDPFAAQKAVWNQAKRHVLAALRVQTGKTLVDVLTAPVTEEVEMLWEDIVMWDVDRERARKRKTQLPVPPAISNDYRMEDIRSLRFREVKARAIQFCMHLEKEGVLTRENDWQDLLNDMAGDIRSNNKNRTRRRKEYAAMTEALGYASDKQKELEEQMASYNQYVDSAMATMQKQGKKKYVWPFSKQARHMQSMKKAGKSAQFGSFKYSAVQLYEEHVLLPKEGFSPKQFEKLSLIISSDQVGLFTLELVNPGAPVPNLASCEIRMEDLLQAKFENQHTLDLFGEVARVKTSMILHLVNRKFYS